MMDPNFALFLQLLKKANPGMNFNNPGVNKQNTGLVSGGVNPNYNPPRVNNTVVNNPNNNQFQKMLELMGIFGANPSNFIRMFNPLPKPPISQNNIVYFNVIFINRSKSYKITVQTSNKDTVTSMINNYMLKSNDYNPNLYLYNGQKINESASISQTGLYDNSVIEVISYNDVEGAIN